MIKILCPTDVALNAIAYAAKFSKETGADLTLFYIESLDETTNAELIRGKSLTIEAEAEMLEEKCREISAAFHISCYSEIQPSSRSLAGLISARAEEFDLIIMGTKGADDLSKRLFGTNTYRVIQSTSVPVLYVPNGYIFNKINSVVYAFDYLHDYKLPMEQLKPFLKRFNSKLIVLQIADSLNADQVYELKEIQRQIQNENLDEFKIEFDTVQDTHIAQSIDRYALEKNTDLLALCTHQYEIWEKIFHKSVIKSLSSQARYPVLIFHR